MEQKTTRPQSFVGTVVKTAMKDTATVRVDRFEKHPKYKKYLVRSKKYLVHDPGNAGKIGDRVIIIATKPISKRKHFMIVPSGVRSPESGV
jgi:small subunit ribosomal protein S17